MDIPLAFDTETFPIRPGLAAPPLVCGQFYARGSEPIVLLRDEALDVVETCLDGGASIVAHNTAYDVGVTVAARPRLLDKWVTAYNENRVHDTYIREKLIFLAKGQLADEGEEGFKKGHKFDLGSCVKRRLGIDIDEEKHGAESWRLRYGTLADTPVHLWPAAAYKYAADDPKYCLDVWVHQEEEATAGGSSGFPLDYFAQVRSALWLHFMGVWGFRTDALRVEDLRQRMQVEYDRQNVIMREHGLLRSKMKKGEEVWSRDMKLIKQFISDAYGGKPPMTGGGKKHHKECQQDPLFPDDYTCSPKCKVGVPNISTSRETLAGAPADPTGALAAMAERSATEKVLSTFIPMLEQGTTAPITPRWNELVATGRTSCYGGWQQPPRKGGVRECVIPRPGHRFISADYSFIELCTLAQTCIDLFGFSTLAQAINNDVDPHLDMAAYLLGIPYEDCVRRYAQGDPEIAEYRQRSKVANFGLPGGMGATSFVAFAKAQYNVVLDPEVARNLKTSWQRKWPEMVRYHQYIGQRTQNGGAFDLVQLRSLRTRGDCGFCDGSNSYFQGLAADGAKNAGWKIFEECWLPDPKRDGSGPSPLYGTRMVLFLHDEFIGESPIEKAPAACRRLSTVMVEGMREYVPDVKIKVEGVITDRWLKGAKPTYEPDGVTPKLYVPKPKAA